MFNWAKQQLANVAGTAEPTWGPQAIRPVGGDEGYEPTYTELTRDDLRWEVMDSTNVETQTFYLFSSSGYTAWVQVIYSNVAGMRITVHFNVKIYSRDPSRPHLWISTPLTNIHFSEDKSAFYADDCALELSEDGTFYTIKSLNDEGSVVNLKVTRTCPGFQAGKSGTSLFGTDPENPWGSMRHAFWPRCIAEGSILTKEGPIDFAGRAMFVYALQGMKPHHAAARWNFLNFQGPDYSAILMEFTTPPSYGSTVVNVGGIAKDGALITAGRISTASHISAKNDTENDWPEPCEVRYTWEAEDRHGKGVNAILEGSLGTRVDRLDVMAEVPGFVKTIVASAAGTKPYIYQYMPNIALKLKIGGQEITEEGRIFAEATFISG